MPVPARINATRRSCLLPGLVLLISLTAAPLFARGPAPAIRIPLESLGFQSQSPQFLLAGSSMLTLDYVDNQHLLLTFGVHRLMERIADDPPDDEDRMVEAVLLEVPSGHVLARTDWRFHDNGQYLWNLGHGRFLLRNRDTLTTFAPLINLASGQPFRQRSFLRSPRRIGPVLLSPEADLLIVESVEQMPPSPPPANPLFGPAPKRTPAALGRPGDPTPVSLNFYRLSVPRENGDQVVATWAGIARSVSFGTLPATGAGHIAIVDQGRQHWAFDFHPYHGDVKQLAPFDSTCRPTVQFVSSSEFVSFGCHGGNTPLVLGGFNMRGEEMWEQNLFSDFVALSFAFAPSSGRFALGRVLGGFAADTSIPITTDAFTGQTVTVYQTESGKQILHVDCSPVARAGQNFALSPDGMKLAVIRENAVQIYTLPPLSTADRVEVNEARALIPHQDQLPIDFAVSSAHPAAAAESEEPSSNAPENAGPVAAKADSPEAPKAPSTPAPAPAAAVAPKPAVSNIPSGYAAPEQPRKPPTLYTLPSDPADAESKSNQPK
jgi:hypothetical protein